MAKTSKSADKSIKNTGERMVPAYMKGKLEYGEHIVRYEALKDLVKGKTVLDIASGSGFGSEIISRSAKKVIGVDNSMDAIEYASNNFSAGNITYIQGDATNIPLDDASVDVAVSFETLEHIEDYNKFIAELKRVLKPAGMLVLSTPNDIEFPEGADFHVHEFKNLELQKLVKKHFKNLKPYFQVTWKYNALLDEKSITRESAIPVDTFNVAPIDLKRVLYFYFLCSDRQITEKVEPVGAISEHWSTRDMLEHNATMDKYIRDTIKHFERIIIKKDEEILSLRRQLKEFTVVRRTKRVTRLIKRKVKGLRS